jgi:CD109 antigen
MPDLDPIRKNTYFHSFLEQNFELRITGRSESGQTIDIREDTTVASDQTQIVRIRIGDLGQGSYTLTARGRSPIEFDQSQKLEYVHKGYSIFIQTDKAIYRPGKNTHTLFNVS